MSAESESSGCVPEGFRQIPGYPRYAIDKHGTVLSACMRGSRSIRPWSAARRLTPTTDIDGYHFVRLRHDGRECHRFVHTLVLTVFVGPGPDGMQCRHFDGNPANNHVSNLSWGTPLENHQDKVRHGTAGIGEKNSGARLTEDDIVEIRRRAANGGRHVNIAADFSVTSHNIWCIVHRRTWKHI